MSGPRIVKLMNSGRPESVWPRARNLGSCFECSRSAAMTSGSLKKISSASQNETRCRSRFLSTFPSSHSKPVQFSRRFSGSTDQVYRRHIREWNLANSCGSLFRRPLRSGPYLSPDTTAGRQRYRRGQSASPRPRASRVSLPDRGRRVRRYRPRWPAASSSWQGRRSTSSRRYNRR